MCVAGLNNKVCVEVSIEEQETMMIDTSSSSNKQRASRRRSSTAAASSPSSTSSSSSTCSDSKHSKRTYVEHTYSDHYNDPMYSPGETEDENGEAPKRRGPRGGVVVPFPERLYTMLSQVENEGFEDVVSWQPHGRCFIVHQPKRFVEEVMPKYFRQSKLTSFQRQVNLYGFRRLTAGKDRGGYYHELFLRGRPDLHRRLVRIRVKGTGFKSASSPATEPDFYTYSRCSEAGPSMTNPEPADAAVQSSNMEAVPDVAMSSDMSMLEDSAEAIWRPLEAPPRMVASTPEMRPLESPKLVTLADIKGSSASESSINPWKIGSGPMTLSSFAKSIVCDSHTVQQQEPCPVTPETNTRIVVSQELDQALAFVSPMNSPDFSPFPSMVSLNEDVSSSSAYSYEDLLSAPLPLPFEESRMASFQDDVDILLSSKDLAADPIVDNILIDNMEVPSDYNLDPLLLLDEVAGFVGCS